MYRVTCRPVGYAHIYRGGIHIVRSKFALLESERGDIAHVGLVTHAQRTGTCREGIFLTEVGITGDAAHTERSREEIARGKDAECALALKQCRGVVAALLGIRGAERLREGVVAVAPEGLVGRRVGIVHGTARRAVTYILAPRLHVAVGDHVTGGSLEGRGRNLLAANRYAALVLLTGEYARHAVRLP